MAGLMVPEGKVNTRRALDSVIHKVTQEHSALFPTSHDTDPAFLHSPRAGLEPGTDLQVFHLILASTPKAQL